MVHPIGQSGGIEPHLSSQSPEERQKLFELQFQTAVISDYVAITQQQHGSVQDNLSKIKSDLSSGKSPDSVAASMNQLISQLNTGVIPGKAPFPTFHFSSEGSDVRTISHFALSLEKFINTAAEKGNIQWANEQKLFKDLTTLIDKCAQMTTEQAYSNLNTLVEEVNKALPGHMRLPKVPTPSKK